MHLVRHLDVLVGGLEVFIVFLILVVGRDLLGGLGEVNLGTSSTAAFDDVAGVNLLQAVFLICARGLA